MKALLWMLSKRQALAIFQCGKLREDEFSKMSFFELKNKFGDSRVLDNAVLQDHQGFLMV